VSLEEDALRNARVLNLRLDNVEGVVVKVVVDDALSDSEVLVGILDNWLLEVSVELENLSVVFEPLRSDCRNGVVDLWLTSRYAAERTRHALTHRREELWINIFLEVDSLLCNGAVFDAEKLCLVVARDGRISVGVSREEW
jgi:hypothetical protein